MKIALCYSGQMGAFETAFEYQKKNFLDLNECDVYCYTSNAVSQKDFYKKPIFSFQPSSEVFEYMRAGEGWRKYYKIYGIIYHVKEEAIQSLLWKNLGERIKFLHIEPEIISGDIDYDTNMTKWEWLKKRQLYKLKKVHTVIKKRDKQYDIIVRSRFDVALKVEINIEKIVTKHGGLEAVQNKIFIFGGWGPKGSPMTYMDTHFSEPFVFGCPRVMDIFCSLVDLEYPYPPNPKYVGAWEKWGDNIEYQFNEHMLAHGVEIEYFSTNRKDYEIMRY